LEIGLSLFPIDCDCPAVIEAEGMGFPNGFEIHVRNIQQGRKHNKDKKQYPDGLKDFSL